MSNNHGQFVPPPQLQDINNQPSKVVEEVEKIMSNESDRVVITNSVLLLFSWSTDYAIRGLEYCQAMSASPVIMNTLHDIITDGLFNDETIILCYATGNLTNISKIEEGRAALLAYHYPQSIDADGHRPSLGVESLICSLRSSDTNTVIFAITAIHNLLLDRRGALQAIAKAQIKHGLEDIVRLLGYECKFLEDNRIKFKVIVLECLLTLAYGNKENRLIIKRSGGPSLILTTIRKNFKEEELIETASRVLKSLSVCPENKTDIIDNGGIELLTECIKLHRNHIEINKLEILKTCLWTLRNLSDIINNRVGQVIISDLVGRLLQILGEYTEEPCIITCTLGILANLTCNNEQIKQFICANNGVQYLLRTIATLFRVFGIVDNEILEPAVCTLCHLMNQSLDPGLAEEVKVSIRNNSDLFRSLGSLGSDDLSKALDKMNNLAYSSNNYIGLEVWNRFEG